MKGPSFTALSRCLTVKNKCHTFLKFFRTEKRCSEWTIDGANVTKKTCKQSIVVQYKSPALLSIELDRTHTALNLNIPDHLIVNVRLKKATKLIFRQVRNLNI